jgi:3-hydroxyacyl-[acyl-carrier-protein] dehydratase
MSNEFKEMDVRQIMNLLPHRYPFLLVDKVVDCVPGESITAVKNVTINEPFFNGHFPGKPIMPGVLIIESMAQAAGLLSYATVGASKIRPLYYLVGVDAARFRRTVTAGDQLVLKVVIDREKRGIWKYKCEALVDGKLAVSANIMCAPGGELE